MDGGDDVAHRPDPGPFDLGRQDAPRAVEVRPVVQAVVRAVVRPAIHAVVQAVVRAVVEVFVLEPGQFPAGPAEAPPYGHAPRIPGRRLVERPRDRRPPVDHQRRAAAV
ncbi:hypothetical protein, partial [Microbispora bryophytorum]|uniref:hypothetical protein n=1 Tax=Microbispora bryophytorum TaxID=1460882 RepID=UPI0036116D50